MQSMVEGAGRSSDLIAEAIVSAGARNFRRVRVL